MTLDTDVLDTTRASRRTVVRGAAWTVPVVAAATAAPAFATSACADGVYEIRWANMNSSKVVTGVRTSTSGEGAVFNSALTVTVTSTFGGSMAAGSAPDGASNLGISPFNVGGTGARGLTIMQRSTTTSFSTPRSGNFQTVTLKFNRPVWGLKYTITDIDSASGQYQDRIVVSGSPAYLRQPLVTGAGSSETPFAPTTTNNAVNPETGTGGNVAVDYGSYVGDTYTLTYWNDQSGTLSSNGLQGVFVAGMTLNAETCAQ